MPPIPLIMYDEAFTSVHELDDGLRRQVAKHFEAIISEIKRLRKGMGGFSIISIGGEGRNFLLNIKNVVSKDFYLLMLKKISSGFDIDAEYEIEASRNGTVSRSLTLCSAVESAMISIATKDFVDSTISCTVCTYDDEREKNLYNLSFDYHIDEHKDFIENWGFTISKNYTVFSTSEFYAVMFPGPKEHNPPHVHVRRVDDIELAKYQIDDVKIIKGEPEFFREISAIILEHKETLLAGWARSQKGQLPYVIELGN